MCEKLSQKRRKKLLLQTQKTIRSEGQKLYAKGDKHERHAEVALLPRALSVTF